MSPEEFRRAGHQAVDWIAEYLAHSRDYPVLPRVTPGSLIDALPTAAPSTGEPMESIFADFEKFVLPSVTHWNHPRFMAYFSTSASPAGIVAEMLSAALNTNGMLWKSSPAGTELEQVTLGWLRQWLNLPDEFFGIIYDTASTSTMHAIAAARELADPAARLQGGSGDLILYTSEQAHSSVEKGAIAIGIGQRNVRKIPVDAAFRLRPDALRDAIERDLQEGKHPFCAVATVGTTATASVDPLESILDVCEPHGLWVHVDAAYAGSAAAACPEYGRLLDGLARAHSLVLNPHKWLFTPVDLSAFYTRRPDILRRAFQLVPDYLQTRDDPRALNYMDYGVPLGRRFRALKLWFVMRHYGREGIARVIRQQIEWAREISCWITADSRFELAAPQSLSVVCFRLKSSEEASRRLLESLNVSGEVFLSHAVLNGKFTLRLALGNMYATRADVDRVWELILQAAPESVT